MARPQLCAVDQSMEAREAADVAGRLALRLDAGLVFAHVLPYVAGGKLAQERTVDTARHLLRHVASVHASTCEARFRVASGDPPQKIMEMAREEDAQMVVVGRCSRGRVKADVRGSVSRSLAARCLRPVVIVPAGAADDFRRNLLEQTCSVVCGVDGSEESELAARHAARLAEHLRVRLVLAHAYGQGSRQPAPVHYLRTEL